VKNQNSRSGGNAFLAESFPLRFIGKFKKQRSVSSEEPKLPLGWDCFPGGKLPFALVLKAEKRSTALLQKNEASFFF